METDLFHAFTAPLFYVNADDEKVKRCQYIRLILALPEDTYICYNVNMTKKPAFFS